LWHCDVREHHLQGALQPGHHLLAGQPPDASLPRHLLGHHEPLGPLAEPAEGTLCFLQSSKLPGLQLLGCAAPRRLLAQDTGSDQLRPDSHNMHTCLTDGGSCSHPKTTVSCRADGHRQKGQHAAGCTDPEPFALQP